MMSMSPRSSAGISSCQSFCTKRARTPSRRAQGVGDLDLEADDAAGIVRVLEDVRLPTLQIAPPAQHPRRTDAGEAVAAGRSRRLPSGRAPCQQGDQRDGGRQSQSLSV
jgi:hypothetical protein